MVAAKTLHVDFRVTTVAAGLRIDVAEEFADLFLQRL